MPISKSLKKSILSCLTANQYSMTVAPNAYVGLSNHDPSISLTDPSAATPDGSGMREPATSESEKDTTGYSRVQLGVILDTSNSSSSSINTQKNTVYEQYRHMEVKEDSTKGYVAQNKDIIYFPEVKASWAHDNGTTVEPVGWFLIFDGANATLPIAWGHLTDQYGAETTINPSVGELPIIRAECMKITFE